MLMHKLEGKMGDRPTTVERPVHFRRSEALHARTNDKRINFVDIVGLYVGDLQSSSMMELNFGLELTFNARQVSVNENDYTLAFRCGVLQIDIKNGSILPGSIYRHVLQVGELKVSSKTEGTHHASRKIGGDVGGEVGASLTLISKITAGLRFGIHRETEKKTTQNETIAERILLVYGGGHNHVQVGCPSRGDPRHPRGWLLGSLINDVDDEDRPTPLCVIEATDPAKPVIVHLGFRINPQQPCLFKRHPDDSKGELLDRNLDKINAQMLKRRIKANEKLKNQVATLGAFRDFLRDHGLGAADNDPLVASISAAYISREAVGEDDGR
jgi:hypothetical protein